MSDYFQYNQYSSYHSGLRQSSLNQYNDNSNFMYDFTTGYMSPRFYHWVSNTTPSPYLESPSSNDEWPLVLCSEDVSPSCVSTITTPTVENGSFYTPPYYQSQNSMIFTTQPYFCDFEQESLREFAPYHYMQMIGNVLIKPPLFAQKIDYKHSTNQETEYTSNHYRDAAQQVSVPLGEKNESFKITKKTNPRSSKRVSNGSTKCKITAERDNHCEPKEVIESFPCKFSGCNKIFTRNYNLKSHVKTHSVERPYSCSHESCTWRFTRLHDLKRHEFQHTNIKPHTCKYCNRKFARSDAMRRHWKVDFNCSQQLQNDPEASKFFVRGRKNGLKISAGVN